jgi:hypothetical protein
MSDDWQAAWQPVIDAVGTEFGDDEIEGADAVDRSAVRRYLEPLEFDCPLHYDDGVARAHGYPGTIAPLASYITFAVPALWKPGQSPVFASAGRDAQPEGIKGRRFLTGLEPAYEGYFAADFEIEYLLPVVLGDRLSRTRQTLVSCLPRETKVGRGAFMTWAYDIQNQRSNVVARFRTTMYVYSPRAAEG